MKTFLFLLALLVSYAGISQNRVVKDNIACLYGIKNPEGSWVVKPKYILLTGYTYGYFVVQEGANYGLLAHDGTELLPCEYTKIKPLHYSWNPVGIGQPVTQQSAGRIPFLFQVEKDNQRALTDASGKTILPFKTQFFRTDGQQHIIVTEYREPNHFTSYIDIHGNYVFKDLPGAIEPFKSNQIALLGQKTPGSNGTVEGNVRVINKKGEFISSHVFDRALVCSQNLVVFEDSLGHIGTMDATGRIIIQPRYQLVFKGYLRDNILPCLYSSQHTFIIKDDSGKFGLMNGQGKLLCAPEYDHLTELYGSWKTDQTEWRVQKNGKTGLLSKNGQVTFPCRYDTIYPLKLNHGQNTPFDGYVVSDSNRYGIIGVNGDTILPIKHAFFQYAQNRTSLCGNLDELLEIKFIDNSLSILPIEKVVQLEDFSVFRGSKDHYFVLKQVEKGRFEVIQSKQYLNVLWFQERQKAAIILTTSGKRLDDGDVHSVSQNSRFIVARTSNNTSYLIDAKTARRITEPLAKVEFELNSWAVEQVWSKGVVEPKDSWVLLDTNGQRAGPESFDQVFSLHVERTSLMQDGYWGIYSVKEKKWLIPAKYTCIDSYSDEIYRAQLQNGQWELYSSSTKSPLGPYETLELIFSSSIPERNGSSTLQSATFQATQNGQSFLINSEGVKTSNPTEIKQILIELAYGVHANADQRIYSRGLRIEHNEPDFEVSTLYEQLYDLLNSESPPSTPKISDVNTKKCSCPSSWRMSSKNELSYIQPNAASVSVSQYIDPAVSWDVGYYETSNYINVILVNGEMKRIELRAIFGYNNQLLYNEFKRAIQLDETLNLDCSTVENMLELIGNNFKFDEKGLVLIVEQYSGQPAHVTIPWERLSQLSTTRSFAQIFLR